MQLTGNPLPVFLSRSEVNDTTWDACVAASQPRIVYGYAWYLDAVLPGPDRAWVGLVLPGENGTYQAVMPVPLRRRYARWVVHQPLFCQMLGVFSRDATLDTAPFIQEVQQRFRYVIGWSVRQQPAVIISVTIRPQATHVLDLSVGYDTLYDHYTRDRRTNLRRAQTANWLVTDSTDVEPLLTLFRDNHADGIRGGVAGWSYDTFRRVFSALHPRGLATLRYAHRDGRPEAGALFVREGDRIIYLFNAASQTGRQGNARTLLLDQMIHEYAGEPVIFDFESPEKESIRQFYRSFGSVEEPFWRINWNRLSLAERWALQLKQRLFRAGT